MIDNNNGYFYGNTDDNGQYSLWYYKDSSGNNINGILIDSITVYPVCEYHEKVTYIFNANGGTFSDGTEIYEEVFTNSFSYYIPYLEGYTFKGWSTATTGGVFINNITKDLEGHTLYARWCKDDDFFVKSALVGDFGEGYYLIPEEDGTHTYTFTYDKNQLWWESAEGSLQFKLQKLNGDWNDSYGSANPTIGGDYVECFTGDQNITVSGLTHGTTYTITFKYENDCVYVKIAETE
ncbi:MAG: InlB B-repeat-containing protein [Treponemataceae bacterium]|nr:InlB B-repeat-containing protein [Treponemataceae bacterium]